MTQLLTTTAAAVLLGTNRRQVLRWIHSGQVPATPVLDEKGQVAAYVLEKEKVLWLAQREPPK